MLFPLVNGARTRPPLGQKARMPMFVAAPWRAFAAAAAALLAGACSTPDQTPVASADLVVLEQSALPPPTAGDLAVTDRPSVIGPFDRLSVNVFAAPELSLETVQVDSGGQIAVPLLGAMNVAGSSPDEVAGRIARALQGRYLRDPQVTVNVLETRSHTFAIEGEVREPGNYPVIGQMSLLRAIAAAKGTTEFALLDNVVVFRTVGNQRMAALYNLQAIRRGIYEDPQVYSNDVIVVGNSQARRIFRDVLQVLPALASPLVVLLNNQ